MELKKKKFLYDLGTQESIFYTPADEPTDVLVPSPYDGWVESTETVHQN